MKITLPSTFHKTYSLTFLKTLTVAYFIFYLGVKILFIFSGYDLFTEEAQYWLWSRYPAWSYYSKPPMIAWVNYATSSLGHHDSIIRFTALAFGSGSLFMMYRLTLLLFREERVALLSTVLLSVTPYFILASTFFTTDSLLVFFWIVTGFCFTRAIQTEGLRDWRWAGFFFGLGCLSKYSMFFFLLAMLPLIFIPNSKRPVKGILSFLTIGAIMCAPIMIWNYQHDWVSFRHVSALSYQGSADFSLKRSLLYLSEFLGGVVLINSPFLLYILLKFKTVLTDLTEEGKKDKRKLLWLLVPVMGTMIVFFMMSVFKRTEVNWPAMSYVSIPIILAYITRQSAAYTNTLRLTGITFLCIVCLLFPRVLDRLGLQNLLPLKIDSMKRMAGWEELSHQVSSLQKQYPAHIPVITDSYHVASEISFYGQLDNVYCINLGRRMNQFDLWAGSRLSDAPDNRILYVTELSDVPDHTLNFESIEMQYTFPVTYRGEVIRTFHIFVLKNFVENSKNGFSIF